MLPEMQQALRQYADLAVRVGLQRAGQRDGLLDKGLQAIGAQVGGAVARVAAVDVEADAEAARGALLDLLDLAVADGDHAVGMVGDVALVGHQDDGVAALVQLARQVPAWEGLTTDF